MITRVKAALRQTVHSGKGGGQKFEIEQAAIMDH